MTKLPKFFLIISLASFALGAVVCLSNLDFHPSWAVAVPVGAIFFGLFLNAYMLQGEVAKFDEENRARFAEAMSNKDSESHQSSHAPALRLAITATK